MTSNETVIPLIPFSLVYARIQNYSIVSIWLKFLYKHFASPTLIESRKMLSLFLRSSSRFFVKAYNETLMSVSICF